MIDELDLLKKNWQKIDQTFIQVSENQIYKMIHQKSTNIVKWILMISIIELAFFILSTIYFKFSNNKDLILTPNEKIYFNLFEFISLVILLFYIYKFYKNYKKISFDNSLKDLLKNIVNTRKTVENYVKITMGYSILSAYFLVGMVMVNHGILQNILVKFTEKGGSFLFYVILIFTIFISVAIVYGIMWLFYKLLYGILLKKLLQNYKEIKQMEL
ncbi:MAG: hypothetical protein ACOVQ2_08665 [Flavobacterium sp.]